MSEINSQTLSSVSETLLVTLYLRAMETQRPDALIKDEKAVELVTRLSSGSPIRYDFERIKLLHLNEANKMVIILRSREFDRYAANFLARHSDAVVVHIGCGLDSRFERVDNGQVEWYDLDLPDVIELRRKLTGSARQITGSARQITGDEAERYHLLGCSVLEDAWLEALSVHRKRPFLFLAEGVFMYLEEIQAKSLVLLLRNQFPGAELVFDAYSPIHNLVSNLQTSIFGFHAHWGIWHGQEVEAWGNASTTGAGIRLLDEWCYLDEPDPRLSHLSWLRPIESIFRTHRIYHFQLGKTGG